MSHIRIIYSEEPNFPATDNSPNSVRYQIGNYWIDAEGGEPTQVEIEAFIAGSAPTEKA